MSPPEFSRRLVRTREDSWGLSRTQVSVVVGSRDVWGGLTKRRYDSHSRVVAKLRHYSRTRCREAPREHLSPQLATVRDCSRPLVGKERVDIATVRKQSRLSRYHVIIILTESCLTAHILKFVSVSYTHLTLPTKA